MMTNITLNILKNEYFANESCFPKCATKYSTGFDLIATSDPEIVGKLYTSDNNDKLYSEVSYIQYHTGLFVKINGNIIIDALIFPRSSISKYNLQLANSVGLCDNDYTGEYLVRFNYVWQPSDFNIVNVNGKQCLLGNINKDKIYKKGDKICQLKFSNVIHPYFKLVNSLEETERGSGGFGSTDISIKEGKMIDFYLTTHNNTQHKYTEQFNNNQLNNTNNE